MARLATWTRVRNSMVLVCPAGHEMQTVPVKVFEKVGPEAKAFAAARQCPGCAPERGSR